MRNFIRFILMSLLVIITHFSANCQNLRYQVALPYLGMGAYSTQQADPFSFTSNQAALAVSKSAAVGVYGERRFMLSENSAYGIALAIPTKMGNFGVQANYAGFKNFNESKLGVAFGRALGSKLSIGAQFNYYNYQIPQYQTASAINFEGGVIVHLTDKLNAGLHVYNPVGGSLGKSGDEKLAAAYKLGVGYDASENFYASVEVLKEENRSINLKASVQYQFIKQFFARAGFMSETETVFAGFGLAWQKLRLDISGSYHPQLGFSPGLMLIYNFKEAKP